MTRQRYLNRSDHDLALLAAGEETGWWDDRGRPAPWPEDFWLADGTINPDWQTAATDPEEDDSTDDQPY